MFNTASFNLSINGVFNLNQINRIDIRFNAKNTPTIIEIVVPFIN
jgi:hypothetical protein